MAQTGMRSSVRDDEVIFHDPHSLFFERPRSLAPTSISFPLPSLSFLCLPLPRSQTHPSSRIDGCMVLGIETHLGAAGAM
eukprot:767305-Hanusia_phi.AAC.9